MPPFAKMDTEQRFAWALIAVAFCVFVGLLIASGCSEESSDDPQVDSSPCLQSCADFDLCFGFDGTGETMGSCQDNCEETSQAENDCIEDCEPIADCDQWWACISGC